LKPKEGGSTWKTSPAAEKMSGFSVATFNKRHFDKIEGLELDMLLPAPE
jgi:hypothetical protein